MKRDFIIKIKTYDDYRDNYNYDVDLQNDYKLMDCPKDVAEQILKTNIEDFYDSNIRCTHCGHNKIVKIFSKDLAGYLKYKDNSLDFVEDVSTKSDLYLDKYECSVCGEVISYGDSFIK